MTDDPAPAPGRRGRARPGPGAADHPGGPVPRLPDRGDRLLCDRGGRADRAGRAQRPDLPGERRVHGHRRLLRRSPAAAPALAAGRGAGGQHRDHRAQWRGGRRGGGPAARPVPGRRHLAAGGGPAVAGAQRQQPVRRRPGAHGGSQHARLPRPQLPADPLAGVADLWLRADHPGPAGQPGAQPGRPVLAGGRRRRGGRRAGRAERGPAPGACVRGQRGVCLAWPACCWR